MMKPFLFTAAAITSSLLLPLSAYAAMTFDPVSPQEWDVSITVTCDTGDKFMVYAPDDTGFLNGTCGGTMSGDETRLGDYTVIECDSTLPGAACDVGTDPTPADGEADPGYISTSTFTFTGTPPPPPTPATPWDFAFSSATTTANAQYIAFVDIPTLDYFMLYMTFMSAMIFVMWVFRKR